MPSLPLPIRQLVVDTWRLPPLPPLPLDESSEDEPPHEGPTVVRADAELRARGALDAAEALLDDERSPRLSHSAEGVLSLLSLSIAWSVRAHEGVLADKPVVPLPEGMSVGVPATTRSLAERALEASADEIARASERTLRAWIAATTTVARHALANAIPGATERASIARRRRRAWIARAFFALVVVLVAVAGGRRLYLGPNLAAGHTWTPSSRYIGYQRELGMVDGNPASLLFHTNQEQGPSAVLDLGEVRTIKRIRILNRAGFETRALPLTVELSVDGIAWEVVTKKEEWFLVWSFRLVPRQARFVRVKAHANTFLHLEGVEVR